MTTPQPRDMPVAVPGMWPYDAPIIGDGASTPRIRAISAVLAAQMADFPGVRAFRAAYLGGELLSADQVDTWIKTRPESSHDHRPAEWLCDLAIEDLIAVADGSYIIPAPLIERARTTTRHNDDAPYITRRWLVYATPKYDHAREPIHAAHGILDTLRTLARTLVEYFAVDLGVDEYGNDRKIRLWQEAQATTFILTGYAPLVPEDAFPLPARSGRRQTDKHAQLAAFVAHHDVLGTAPAERLAQWNERFPQWAYKNTTNFGWDSRQAIARQPTHTAAEVKTAFEEKRRQMGGTTSAIWGGEIDQLLEDAKRRSETHSETHSETQEEEG